MQFSSSISILLTSRFSQFFDAIVIIAAFILNPRARRRERERQRALAASNGVSESSPATGTDTFNAPNSHTSTIETSAGNTVTAAEESRPAVDETEEKDMERGVGRGGFGLDIEPSARWTGRESNEAVDLEKGEERSGSKSQT